MMVPVLTYPGGEVLSDLVNENIYKLLHRHEKYHMTSETSKYWLHREAAANENVTKAGTFRYEENKSQNINAN